VERNQPIYHAFLVSIPAADQKQPGAQIAGQRFAIKDKVEQDQWCIPASPATQAVDIGKIKVPGQLEKKLGKPHLQPVGWLMWAYL
jgi:hypothetical protein